VLGIQGELGLPSIEEIRSARERISLAALDTPLVRLGLDDAPAEIFLKLENLQPIGSFKVRGAGNAMALVDPERLARGVYTASAGNMAQGVAWTARRMGVRAAAVVPDTAPEAKLAAVARLGAEIVMVTFDEWWKVLVDHGYAPFSDRHFVHPLADRDVMAGNATIGLEILEAVPDLDAVVVPFGGGGLSSGIACAVKALRPGAKVFAAEVATAAPLAASLAAGEPVLVEHTHTFVDGIGSKGVLPDMWPLVRQVLDGSLVVDLAEAAAALRLMVERNHVVAEGAGAAGVAAALAGKAGTGKIVCIVSGGNIDSAKLAALLEGRIPD
jgi:threonine dehydratase